MKKWKKMLIEGLVICYFTYIFTGFYYSGKKAEEYNRIAKQKADINQNSKIEADEVLRVYKDLGLSGEEIFKEITDHKTFKKDFILNSFSSNKNKYYLETILKIYDKTYDKPVTKKINKELDEFVRKLADKNNNEKIDLNEASEAFKICEKTNLDNYWLLDPFTSKFFLCLFISPYKLTYNSELEKFLKIK